MKKIGLALVKYGAILAIGVACCILTHVAGNRLPYDVAVERFATAFARGNLTEENYNQAHGLQSVYNLRGQEHFVECQIGSGILGDSQREERVRGTIEDAIIQKNARSVWEFRSWGASKCRSLQSIVVDQQPRQVGDVTQFRYLWGYKAIYAILLKRLSVFQIREVVKAVTFFCYLILAVTLFALSRRLFLLLSPVIICGFFFSAIQYYSTLGNALGYLWALVTAITFSVYLLRIKRGASARHFGVIAFVCGMVSAFVWFLDGHLHFLIPLMASVIYFGTHYALHYSFDRRYRCTKTCIALFGAGFMGNYIIHQLLKATIIGWRYVFVDSLWRNGVLKKLSNIPRVILRGKAALLNTIQRTSSAVAKQAEEAQSLAEQATAERGWSNLLNVKRTLLPQFGQIAVWGITGLWQSLVVFSMLCFLFSAGMLVVARWRAKIWHRDPLVLLACAIGSYLFLPFIHDNLHQAARFVFVPCAFSIASTIWILRHRSEPRRLDGEPRRSTQRRRQ